MQKHKCGAPSYQVVHQPAGGNPNFIMEVCVGDDKQEGVGSTKKAAKTAASWKLFRKLKRDICGVEVEGLVDEGDSPGTSTLGEDEVEEEIPQHFNYSDLAEFQGSVKCRTVSEYGCFDTSRNFCHSLVNVDELPELDELDMTRSQIIEEQSDSEPVVSPSVII